ncbi:MAG: type II toxin-antitoxin system RelE/ParE family toxin [Propionivibrio sp.]|nr:type II toxin-antitoxin system RelE/ParE family toxin [Propionivibrio sp.]
MCAICFQKKTQKTRKEDIELAARRYRQIGD